MKPVHALSEVGVKVLRDAGSNGDGDDRIDVTEERRFNVVEEEVE